MQQKDFQRDGGEEGLDAVPRDRDRTADECRDVGAPDAPRHPGYDRVRCAGVMAHEAGHAAAAEDDERAAEDSERHLNRAEADQEEACGEGVVTGVVRVVHPQREQAVGRPLALVRFGGLEVLVVEAPFGILSRKGNGVELLGWHRVSPSREGMNSPVGAGRQGPAADALLARSGESPCLTGGQAEPDEGLGEFDGGGDAVDDGY